MRIVSLPGLIMCVFGALRLGNVMPGWAKHGGFAFRSSGAAARGYLCARKGWIFPTLKKPSRMLGYSHRT